MHRHLIKNRNGTVSTQSIRTIDCQVGVHAWNGGQRFGAETDLVRRRDPRVYRGFPRGPAPSGENML